MELRTVHKIIDSPRAFLKEMNLMQQALSGDIAFSVSPATAIAKATAQNAEAYTRDVLVKVVNSAGEVHKWFNGSLPVTFAESTAGNGAVTGENHVHIVNGEGIYTLSYSGTFSGGVKQVETATVVGTISEGGEGDAEVVVTCTGMEGTPKTLAVPVTAGDASHIAGEIRAFLAEDEDVTALFDVSGTGATIVLTAKEAKANISNLNVAIATGSATGITTAASSANTTAGVAPDTNTFSLSQASIAGVTCTAKTSVETSSL